MTCVIPFNSVTGEDPATVSIWICRVQGDSPGPGRCRPSDDGGWFLGVIRGAPLVSVGSCLGAPQDDIGPARTSGSSSTSSTLIVTTAVRPLPRSRLSRLERVALAGGTEEDRDRPEALRSDDACGEVVELLL